MGATVVPHRELSEAALAAVVEEYVTRDGTELTDAPRKTAEVLELLDRGELVLVYDARSESCNIVGTEDVERIDEEDGYRVELDDEPGC